MTWLNYLALFIDYAAIGSTVAAAIGWVIYAAWETIKR